MCGERLHASHGNAGIVVFALALDGQFARLNTRFDVRSQQGALVAVGDVAHPDLVPLAAEPRDPLLARGEIVRGLTTAASIWTVAAIGLAVGGGLYFAAGLSTAIILAILAGVKPLEEAYRDRNQTCRLVIETARGALTPEILKAELKVRNGQIKRFQARARDAVADDLTVILARVSSNDIASFIPKIRSISGVTQVTVASRHSDEPERSPD
jgi:hypothetical protein